MSAREITAPARRTPEGGKGRKKQEPSPGYRGSMRSAVIWSELLAPPLALRKKR